MGKLIALLTLAIATVALPAKSTSMKELTFLTRWLRQHAGHGEQP